MYETDPTLYTTTASPEISGAVLTSWFLFFAVLTLVMIVAVWKIFTKAGQAGWKSLIPIYSFYVLLKIIGRPGWWLLLLLVPLVNIVITIIVYLDLAKVFGKSAVFGVFGLLIFTPVGLLMLAFGNSKYVGPGGSGSGGAAGSGGAPAAAPAPVAAAPVQGPTPPPAA